MAYGEIRAIDWSCRSYRLGHHPHLIQAKRKTSRLSTWPLRSTTTGVWSSMATT